LKAKKAQSHSPGPAGTEKATRPTLSYEERKRQANRFKALPKKRDALLATIERLEAEKAEIQAKYAKDGFFADTPVSDQKKLQARESQLEVELGQAIHEWEEVETELAELEVNV
jgi:hypothetical protein